MQRDAFPSEPALINDALLRCALEKTDDAIAIGEFTESGDALFRSVYVNDSFEAFTGFSRHELLRTENPLLRFQPNRALLERKAVDVRSGKDVIFETQLARKDGSLHWSEIRYSPLSSNPEFSRFFLCVCRDTTARRASEAERLMLYRAIEAAADFFIILDLTPPSLSGPFFLYVNASYAHALAYRPEELVGRSCWDVVALDNYRLLLSRLIESAETLRPEEKEIKLRRRDGTTMWMEFAGKLDLSNDGTPKRWVVVGRDISSRRGEVAMRTVITRAIDLMPIAFRVYAVQDGKLINVFENVAADAQGEIDEATLAAAASANTATAYDDGSVTMIPMRNDEDKLDGVVFFGPLAAPRRW